MSPLVVLGLIVVLIAIQAALNWAPDAVQDGVVRDFAFVPGRLTISIWPRRRSNCSIARIPIRRRCSRPRRSANCASGRRSEAVDAPDLRLSAWLVDACAAQQRLAHRVRAADRAAVRLGEVPSVHGRHRDLQRARALGQRADGFLAADRRVGADSGLMGAATRFMFSPGRRSAPPPRLANPKSNRSRRRACAACSSIGAQ